MIIPEPRDLREHMGSTTSAEHLERQWERIDAGRTEARRAGLGWRRPALGLGAMVAVATAVLLWVRPGAEPSPAAERARVVQSIDERTVLDPGARIELVSVDADGALVRLSGGVAEFGASAAGGELSVRAGDYVVDAGASAVRIEVDPGGDEVDLAVSHGEVEVRSAFDTAAVWRVTAGQRWSSQVDTRSGPRAWVAPAADPAVADEPAEGADEPAEGADELVAPAARDEGPAQLLGAAQAAVAAGRFRRASRLLKRLVDRYPKDSRAGLAAFELARLRMDRLGDAKGAAQALRRARGLPGGAALGDDIDARIVEALEKSGDGPACLRAQERYFARHPRGLHTSVVRTRCSAL